MMTPKEKAEELVDRFKKHADSLPDDYDNFDPVSYCEEKHMQSAKQCALICVDEILDLPINEWVDSAEFAGFSFWREVKQEILKLK